MLTSGNLADIYRTKKDSEQITIEKLYPHQQKRFMGVWKTLPEYMTKQTT